MEQETDFIPDLPEGPLNIYRKQASFDWKKLKLVFDKPLHSPCICNMLNDHCQRVSTHLQSINIIIIIIFLPLRY